jgi:hypothetical protein
MQETTLHHPLVPQNKVATHQSRQVNLFGKENINQQPKRITSPDHPITKKLWQDEMADIGQMCTSMLSITTFIKEHIPQTKSPNYQNPTNQNARKKSSRISASCCWPCYCQVKVTPLPAESQVTPLPAESQAARKCISWEVRF